MVTRPIRGFCALQVYVEGQTAVTASGETVGRRDLVAQIEQVVENLEQALAAGRVRLEQVIEWTIYVVSNDSLAPAFAVFRRVWGRRPNPVGLQYIDKESCCTPRRSSS